MENVIAGLQEDREPTNESLGGGEKALSPITITRLAMEARVHLLPLSTATQQLGESDIGEINDLLSSLGLGDLNKLSDLVRKIITLAEKYTTSPSQELLGELNNAACPITISITNDLSEKYPKEGSLYQVVKTLISLSNVLLKTLRV